MRVYQRNALAKRTVWPCSSAQLTARARTAFRNQSRRVASWSSLSLVGMIGRSSRKMWGMVWSCWVWHSFHVVTEVSGGFGRSSGETLAWGHCGSCSLTCSVAAVSLCCSQAGFRQSHKLVSVKVINSCLYVARSLCDPAADSA